MTQADISEELPDYIDTDNMDEEGGDEGGQLYEHYRVVADKGQQLLRVDKFLLDHLKDTSRNRIQAAAKAGFIHVNDKPVKSNYRVKPFDVVTLLLDRPRYENKIEAENIPLDIVYEDSELLVVNKPAGLVVHPGCGNYTGTLVNAIAWHLKDDPKYDPNDPSVGLVHRIDYPVIRYAEVLLTYAEARAELNELTQSDLDNTINLIRDRAGMPHMLLSPQADPALQEAFPGVSPLLLEIRRERRVELVFEGFRFDDLMRWKAGKLLEKEPEGLYFPGLGKYDLTGDGIEDIYLIPSDANIPAEADKETNSLGEKLVYYRTGSIDDVNATVYLREGTKGNILTIKDMGTFQEPKYYYRPVPKHEMDLNPNLGPQLFGWE